VILGNPGGNALWSVRPTIPNGGTVATTTRNEVKRRLKRGQKVRTIAESLGVSTQMVYAYRRDLIADGELPASIKKATAASGR
jgi:hypothetical protein